MNGHSKHSAEEVAAEELVRPETPAQPLIHESVRPKFIVTNAEDSWLKPGSDRSTQPPLQSESLELETSVTTEPQDSSGAGDTHAAESLDQPDLDSWRAEVSARLDRYRARRRPRAPRYPSLRLKFDPAPTRTSNPATPGATSSPSTIAASAPATCQALAMSPVEEETPTPPEIADEPQTVPVEPQRAPQVSAKILEFPRWSYAPPMPMNDLADPIVDLPRILEVPEVVTEPPAMGGITIEDSRPLEPERRPGIDMPLRTAPLGLRVWAMLVDWVVVLSASALFAYISARLIGTKPPLWELIGLGVALPCTLWAAYQYLFMVYCGTTLGLQAAHLHISRFDGTPVNRRRRRTRVLCGFLSGLSLGMGYAWQFLDEDRLCWHERVTRTYLAPSA